MLKRRDLIRGAGIVGVGSLLPISALAGPQVDERSRLAHPVLDDLVLQDRSSLAAPPTDFASNHNYWIYGGGEPIRGLKVTIQVDEDMVMPTGMGLQLNALTPPDASCVWQQYIMIVDPKKGPTLSFDWVVENWPSPALRWDLHNRAGFPCGSAPNPTADTCKGNSFNVRNPLGTFSGPNDRIPAGYRLTFELLEDDSGVVIGARYAVADGKGHLKASKPVMIGGFDFSHTRQTVLPDYPQAMAPIVTFQMNLVGSGNGVFTELTSGAGTITYEATTPLTAQGVRPVPRHEAGPVFTTETSNVRYAELATGARQKIVQRFRTPPPAPSTAESNSAGSPCPPSEMWDRQKQQCELQHRPVYDQAPRR